MQRYFLDETPEDDLVVLPEDIQHHLMTVLRGKIGTKAEFIFNHKIIRIGEVISINDQKTVVKLGSVLEQTVELPVDVTLILGLTKGDKPDDVIKKATELGAHHFILVETEWSVAHWGSKADRKIARLNKIAQGAAEQSHRLQVPTIQYFNKIEQLELNNAMVKVVAWEESAKSGEKGQLVKSLEQAHHVGSIGFMVGPEGGLSKSELERLEKLGFKKASLGARILRAETAPLYIMSAISFALELDHSSI
ncbi:16S rRNA (uracil(1498)-N(3))-methyltransferase [Weissella coleopterorum]|uniref:Ribosomal RNA small subunit methyltransferase E n=1 Tax=Weissella coleopterorum TaxID=2714949 RepID=A0A6G8AZK9_9LACO|nr:RsmE family RNA methyltransferase [Weissella coleopterorum]QIL50531.1 16S rRNA (uracil(1498)-N(3))-methyltransferase [Weissella coleopterorum]